MEGKHDELFQKIFHAEKNIACFFDAFFGFMYRRTDFYTVTDGRPPGYPPGISREILFSLYEKWKREEDNKKDSEKKDEKKKPESSGAKNHPMVNDDIVFYNNKFNFNTNCRAPLPPWNERKKMFVDCQNGASYDKYRWSQSPRDLDVVVLLPPEALEAKDLQVRLITKEMQIKAKDDVIVTGAFPYDIKSGDSFWFLEPGKQLNIHIEKAREGWWDRLLDQETPIDVSKLEPLNNRDEQTEKDIWATQELLWNQRLKDLAEQAEKEGTDTSV